MFAATRSRCGGLALLVALLCAAAAAPARGAVAGDYAALSYGGAQVATIGDVSGDGVGDLAVGNPAANSGQGEVTAISGATGAVIWRAAAPSGAAETSNAGQPLQFGGRVAMLGDVAGCNTIGQEAGDDCFPARAPADGVPELLVSAPGGDAGPSADQGRVYVLDGKTGAVHRRLRLGGDLPISGNAEFGFAIGSAGDVNGDGEPEAAVGAPGYTETFETHPLVCEESPGSFTGTCEGAGRVYLFASAQLGGPAPSGSPTSDYLADDSSVALIQNPDAQPESAGSSSVERFGDSVLSFGSRLLIGAPELDVASVSDAGAMYLADGATESTERRIDAPNPQVEGHFGAALAGGSQPLVGAPGLGIAYRIDVDTGNPSASFVDPELTGGFGASVASLAGDVAAIGSPARTPFGVVRVFQPGGALVQTICDPAREAGGGFGTSIASLADTNSDDFDDLAIGATAGRAYLLTSKRGGGAAGPTDCVPGGPGDTSTGDGSGDGGGGSQATPPRRGGTGVVQRVTRRLALRASRKRVRKNRSFRLRGRLRARAGLSACQNRQKIALQRRRSGRRYQTFEVAVTRRSGAFTARAIAQRTYVYRARVSQTSRCMGAVSRTAKVSVRRAAHKR